MYRVKQFGIISLLIFLTTSVTAFPNKDPEKRLSRLYEKDKEKCLVVSTRKASKQPQNPSPHYYLAKLHFEQFQAETSERKKISALSRSLTSSRNLLKTNVSDWKLLVNWNELRNEILDSTRNFSIALHERGNESGFNRLARKYERITKTTIVIEKKEEKEEDEVSIVPLDRHVQGHFYGLAHGTENIPSFNEDFEVELLRLINEERVKRKLRPLIMDPDLCRAARYHAYDMATQRYFSHTSHDRDGDQLVEVGNTFKRIRKFYNRSFVNSENIAAGGITPHHTYRQWFTSKGHHDNMFYKSSGRVGIGVVYDSESPFGHYWVFCTAYPLAKPHKLIR